MGFKDLISNKLDKMFPHHLKTGDEYLMKQNYKKAIEYYEKAAEVQGQNPHLYYNWAASLYALGKYKESLEMFKRAVHYKPDYSDAYCHWGLALANLGQPHQAVNKFRAAKKIAPNDPKIYFHMGMLMENILKHDKATENYNKVIELCVLNPPASGEEPNMYHIMALNQLALQDLRNKKFAEAGKKFKELVTLSPDFGPAYFNLAMTNVKTNQPEEAVKNLLKSIEINPEAAHRVKQEKAFQNILKHPDLQNVIK